LRGDKPGKIYFGQMLERVKAAQIQYDGVVAKLKRLNGLRRMTSAVAAGIAIIIILVLFKRGTGALVRSGNVRICCLGAC
jgi:hypothetical protein